MTPLLSKTERDFLKSPYHFPKKKAKKFRYKIKKKLKIAKQDLELLIENCDDARISLQQILDVTSLSGSIDQKEILRSPKKGTKRYESLSRYENW